jgi:hypothetical protein
MKTFGGISGPVMRVKPHRHEIAALAHELLLLYETGRINQSSIFSAVSRDRNH